MTRGAPSTGRPSWIRARTGPGALGLLASLLAGTFTGLPAAPAEVAPPDAPTQVRSGQPPPLDDLLRVMERVASLYQDSALGFVASERILWDTPRRGRFSARFGVSMRSRSLEFDYFYVAEDSPTGTRLGDYRTPRDNPDGDRIQLSDQELPGYILRPYSWVFVFLPGNRPLFEFAAEGDGSAQGRPAHVVRFAPATASYQRGVSDAFGRVWIDTETRGLLRVDAVRSDQVIGALEQAGAAGAPAPSDAEILPVDARFEFHSMRVDYGEERNGLRFPTRARLQFVNMALPEAGHAGFRAAADKVLERGIAGTNVIDHRFSDYRFFSVRTAAEVQEILRGVRIHQ